jgi:hypothetical protein
MTLSYAIPVCNEWIQLEYLLDYLFKNKREQDEIVIQCDEGNTTSFSLPSTPTIFRLIIQLLK